MATDWGEDIRKRLAAAEEEDDGSAMAHELRLDLASMILKELRKRGMTQREYAQLAGLPESRVSRVIHAQKNCTFRTAARLLAVLGIKLQLAERTPRVMTTQTGERSTTFYERESQQGEWTYLGAGDEALQSVISTTAVQL